MAYTGVDKWGKTSAQKDSELKAYRKNFIANNPGKELSAQGLEDIYNRRNQESVDAKAANKGKSFLDAKVSGVSAQEAANKEAAINRAKQSKADRDAQSAAAQNNARVMGEQQAHQKGAGRFEGSAAAQASATGNMMNTGATTNLNQGMQTGGQQTPLTRKQELEQQYDKEVFHLDPSGDKSKNVTGDMGYVYGYVGESPMQEGQDQGEYMQGMKDNWVNRQLLGEKYDKEVFHLDPSGDKSKNVTGDMGHVYGYVGKSPMQEGQDQGEYLQGMKDDWIDRQMLGQKYDKEIFHKDPGGDQSKHVTGDLSHAHAYIAKSPMQEGQDEGEYLQGMKDDWINQQMDAGKGYQQGINAKNAWKKEGSQSKGKEFLDKKVAEQKPSESTTQAPETKPTPGVKDDKTAPATDPKEFLHKKADEQKPQTQSTTPVGPSPQSDYQPGYKGAQLTPSARARKESQNEGMSFEEKNRKYGRGAQQDTGSSSSTSYSSYGSHYQ